MRTNAVAAGLLVALAVLAVAAMGGAVADTHTTETGANASSGNASVGAEVSSFMQASTAEAEGEVDDGMFDAALSRTEDPEERRQLIENRTQRLEERQQRLEERRADIRSTGNVRDRALAVRVAVGATQLTESVNETEPVAASAGVNTTRLEQLRTNARDLSGGEVAELARSLAGPPGDRPGVGGPPVDSPAGNASEERPDRAGNASIDRPGNGSAERGEADHQPKNGSTDERGSGNGPADGDEPGPDGSESDSGNDSQPDGEDGAETTG
ncbi:hypothetical protein HWV23_14810 [Natronomonas halophila]|uniref:hypothetical protein n=1 Tax=Natronomonas halophila TaxID=2747817 RepID=UPI0015B38513|nr:hypothetical protein [Natronomonas halophila]QLD86944.1 hypothetical protein HWV23_14810 [Natronomonas halophila]